MSRPPIIRDCFGMRWRVDETRQTVHGWAVYLGRPVEPDGQCRRQQGNTVIVTAELRDHLAQTIACPKTAALPLSSFTLSKLRRQLGLTWRPWRQQWWEARAADLLNLTQEEFGRTHGVSQGAVSVALQARFGIRKKARERWRDPEVARLLNSGLTSREIAERVGIAPGSVWRWRKAFRERSKTAAP